MSAGRGGGGSGSGSELVKALPTSAVPSQSGGTSVHGVPPRLKSVLKGADLAEPTLPNPKPRTKIARPPRPFRSLLLPYARPTLVTLCQACAHFGSICTGTDIDVRVLKGKKGRNVFTNFGAHFDLFW